MRWIEAAFKQRPREAIKASINELLRDGFKGELKQQTSC